MLEQFCVAITLPDNDGKGWAELFGHGFCLHREPVYMTQELAEKTRHIVRTQVLGTVVEIYKKHKND